MPIDINTIFLALSGIGILVFFLFGLGYVFFNLYKWRGREDKSIDSVLLEISVPKGNEIKIDAMDQLFAALYAVKKGGGWKLKSNVQQFVTQI